MTTEPTQVDASLIVPMDDWDDITPIQAPEPKEETPSETQEDVTEEEAQEIQDDEEDDKEEEEKKAAEPDLHRKKPRALREKEKRIEAEGRAAVTQQELAIERYRVQQLQEAIDRLTSGSKPQQQTEDDIDNVIRAAGYDPDEIIDKAPFAAIIKRTQSNQASVEQIKQQMVGESIKSSINTAITASPEVADAITFYAQSKTAEALAAADALGIACTPQQAQEAAVEKAQQILVQAHNSGRDPAQAIYALAKGMGFKPKAVAKTGGIDYNKLDSLRDAAGKPPYQAESATSKSAKSNHGNSVDMSDW